MGQTCCRPLDQHGHALGEESWRKSGPTPIIGTLKDLPSHIGVGTLADSDDEFWDARSIGSMSVYSTTSRLSFLSMDDLLDQYQHDLDGDMHDLDEEVEAAAMAGGHLVPKEIEDAAADRMLPTAGIASWFPKWNKNQQETMPSAVHVTPFEEKEEEERFTSQTIGPLEQIQPLPDFFSSETALKELQHAKELIANGRILEAHEVLVQLCEECNKVSSSSSNIDDHINNVEVPKEIISISVPSLIPHSSALEIDIAALENNVHAVHAALSGLEDDSGWMVSRKGELRVLYAHKKGTTQHSLKFHAVFPHPVEHILSLAHEWDLLPTWNKFTLEAIKLAEPSIFESIVYGAQWMMKPFRNMQAIVRARGFDLASSPHKCLLIMINDVNGTEVEALDLDNRYPHLPDAMAKRKTVNLLKNSCIKLRPLPPLEQKVSNKRSGGGTSTRIIPRTDAHLMVHLDPHIPYVPSSLVNFVLGILAPYIFNQMAKVLESAFKEADGEFPKRVREQPELYGLVEKRMAEFADELVTIHSE